MPLVHCAHPIQNAVLLFCRCWLLQAAVISSVPIVDITALQRISARNPVCSKYMHSLTTEQAWDAHITDPRGRHYSNKGSKKRRHDAEDDVNQEARSSPSRS